MPSQALAPNGDGTKTGWTDQASGTSAIWQAVDDDPSSPNDSDYALGSGNNPIAFQLADLPSDAVTVTGVDIVVRISVSRIKSNNRQFSTVAIYQSDESTALTATCNIASATATATNFSFSGVSLPGATDKTTWDAARIKFNTLTGSSGTASIYAIKVTVTYTTASGATKQFVHYFRLRGC